MFLTVCPCGKTILSYCPQTLCAPCDVLADVEPVMTPAIQAMLDEREHAHMEAEARAEQRNEAILYRCEF